MNKRHPISHAKKRSYLKNKYIFHLLLQDYLNNRDIFSMLPNQDYATLNINSFPTPSAHINITT